jgi:hypothetical protein
LIFAGLFTDPYLLLARALQAVRSFFGFLVQAFRALASRRDLLSGFAFALARTGTAVEELPGPWKVRDPGVGSLGAATGLWQASPSQAGGGGGGGGKHGADVLH